MEKRKLRKIVNHVVNVVDPELKKFCANNDDLIIQGFGSAIIFLEEKDYEYAIDFIEKNKKEIEYVTFDKLKKDCENFLGKKSIMTKKVHDLIKPDFQITEKSAFGLNIEDVYEIIKNDTFEYSILNTYKIINKDFILLQSTWRIYG